MILDLFGEITALVNELLAMSERSEIDRDKWIFTYISRNKGQHPLLLLNINCRFHKQILQQIKL